MVSTCWIQEVCLTALCFVLAAALVPPTDDVQPRSPSPVSSQLFGFDEPIQYDLDSIIGPHAEHANIYLVEPELHRQVQTTPPARTVVADIPESSRAREASGSQEPARMDVDAAAPRGPTTDSESDDSGPDPNFEDGTEEHDLIDLASIPRRHFPFNVRDIQPYAYPLRWVNNEPEEVPTLFIDQSRAQRAINHVYFADRFHWLPLTTQELAQTLPALGPQWSHVSAVVPGHSVFTVPLRLRAHPVLSNRLDILDAKFGFGLNKGDKEIVSVWTMPVRQPEGSRFPLYSLIYGLGYVEFRDKPVVAARLESIIANHWLPEVWEAGAHP
ncbi:hypothetical protein BCV70DRAFT_202790 [Testicularia cyperi]|uniref:Uncharacterized protein n=1 Tax=Testicularia cyperi TaxID=1882483 RepID=A0A317XI13_9BASI|nr:hypothetical protein BCV70DRAFT_202790 [Testicularia cyperi]